MNTGTITTTLTLKKYGERNLASFRQNIDFDSPSDKEKMLNDIIFDESFVKLLKQNNNEILERIVNIYNKVISNNREATTNEFELKIKELCKNARGFGCRVTLPRGLQKIFAYIYMSKEPDSAFINNKFNYTTYKKWVETNLGNKTANALDSTYYENISLSYDNGGYLLRMGDNSTSRMFRTKDYGNEIKKGTVIEKITLTNMLNPAHPHSKSLSNSNLGDDTDNKCQLKAKFSY